MSDWDRSEAERFQCVQVDFLRLLDICQDMVDRQTKKQNKRQQTKNDNIHTDDSSSFIDNTSSIITKTLDENNNHDGIDIQAELGKHFDNSLHTFVKYVNIYFEELKEAQHEHEIEICQDKEHFEMIQKRIQFLRTFVDKQKILQYHTKES
eukprot:UN26016